MVYRAQVPSSFHFHIPLLLLAILIPPTHAKTTFEACTSADSCPSLLSYHLPWDSKISEIAYRFRVNITDVVAANSLRPAMAFLGNPMLPAKSLVKIPISCSCVEGIRRFISNSYTVRPADTVGSISEAYGGLVSADQLMSLNNITRANPLTTGQTLAIPLPCVCFNNSNNGVPSVYMSYVVQNGENISKIAAKFGTTIQELEAVNELSQPVPDAGDTLAIPLTACSSANLDWEDEYLIVPNGSYAFTANNCIKCICGPNDLNLQCIPSGIPAPCSHLQCKRSNLFVGDKYAQQTPNGCTVVACVYRGHTGTNIHRTLVNISHVRCIGKQGYKEAPREAASAPLVGISPYPSAKPSSASNQTKRSNVSVPATGQVFNSSSDARLLGPTITFVSVAFQFALHLSMGP